VNTTLAGKSSLSDFGLIHTPIQLGRFVAIRWACIFSRRFSVKRIEEEMSII
jgi:hypothetical protein